MRTDLQLNTHGFETASKSCSWLVPQFSLRLLLLAFTAFAVGFPIWYRWPYEEREIWPSGAQLANTTTTWQRQWGGGRLMHGVERVEVAGQTYEVTTYFNGKKHGPYITYGFMTGSDGQKCVSGRIPLVTGQYADDEMDGVWTWANNDQNDTITYDHGKRVTPPTQTQSPSAPTN